MTPERWQEVERLYQSALERDPAERTAFLASACGTDDALRREGESLLDYLNRLRSDYGVWIALPKEVDRWWRERSRMTLHPEGRGWRIEGAGNERARVAYAQLEGEGLAYSVEPPSLSRDGTSGL